MYKILKKQYKVINCLTSRSHLRVVWLHRAAVQFNFYIKSQEQVFKIIQDLVCKEKDFKFDCEFNREPMKRS